MTVLSGVRNPKIQETDIVEIVGEAFESAGSPGVKNHVAIVVPASARIPSADGTLIRFHNRTDVRVSIWNPRPWYKDVVDSSTGEQRKLGADLPLLELEPGETITVQVDGARGAPSSSDDDRERQFRVFVHGINEFAIGDSPPKMKLDP